MRAAPRFDARYIHLVVVWIVWGSTYFAVRIITAGGAVTALQLQSARMLCAAGLLAVVALVTSGPPRGMRPRDVAIAAASGILMWALGNGLATLVSPHAASSFIVMVMGAIPLWNVGIEAIARRALPSRRVGAGLALGLIGLLLVLAPSLGAGAVVEPGFEMFAVVLLLAGGATWAFGTRLQQRVSDRIPSLWLATTQFATAAVALVAVTAAEKAHLPTLAPEQIVAFLYLVVFGSAIALGSYIIVVQRFSVAAASTFAYVNPVVGLLLGGLVLQEAVAPISLIGLAAILASVAVVLRPDRPRRGSRVLG